MIRLAETENNVVGFQKKNHEYTFLHWPTGVASIRRFRFTYWGGPLKQYRALGPTMLVEWAG